MAIVISVIKDIYFPDKILALEEVWLQIKNKNISNFLQKLDPITGLLMKNLWNFKPQLPLSMAKYSP